MVSARQNWKKRYFVLNGPELLYFQAKDGKQLGKLLLPGCGVQELLPGEVGGARYAFEVESAVDGKVLTLKANGALQLKKWLDILNQASESAIDMDKFNQLEEQRKESLHGTITRGKVLVR